MTWYVRLLCFIWATLLGGQSATAWTHGAPPQFAFTKNIQTDYGAACKGDYTSSTLTITWTAFATTITVFSNTFSAANVGQLIFVNGAGNSSGEYAFAKITVVGAFSGGQQTITVNSGASRTTITNAATVVSWGTDDSPALASFNTFGRGIGASSVLLQWPGTPSTCQVLDPLNSTGGNFSDGIQNLTVDFRSGTLSAPYPGMGNNIGAVYNLGAALVICTNGLTDSAGCSARLNTVSAGATSVFLTSASLSAGYISRFTVGNYMLISGIDMLGFGYPPDPYFYEYVKITAINTGTGEITFAGQPLVNGYKSTWPVYNEGSSGNADQGGPATAYGLTANFQTVAEYRNGNLYMANQETNALGHTVIFRNIAVLPSGDGNPQNCPYPSRNKLWAVYNSDFSFCIIEVDKAVEHVVMDHSSVRALNHQSASPNLLTTNVVTFGANGGMTGVPKNWFDTGSTVHSIFMGVNVFGVTTEVNLTNTSFTTILRQQGTTYTGDAGGGSPFTNVLDIPISAGVLQIPNAQGPQFWAAPGGNYYWVGAFPLGVFQVTDITQDATYTYVHTSLPGGFPAWDASVLSAGKLTIRAHGAPKFTCSGCTGSAWALSLNGAPANSAYGEWMSTTYDGTTAFPWPVGGTQGGFNINGNLVSSTINVTRNYTGVQGSLNFSPTGQFVYTTMQPSTLAAFNWDPYVNLKATAASRVTTCTGPTTCSSTGTQSGDALNTPTENIYTSGILDPSLDHSITSECPAPTPSSICPIINVTIQTHQGVVVP